MRKKESGDKSIWGFLVVACAALMFGIGAAAVQLALRPVPNAPLPSGDTRHEVVCIRGGMAGVTGWEDRAKKVWHAQPGRYVFSEGDLNSLIEKHMSNILAIEGVESVHVEELPNVRMLENGQVQVSTVITLPELAGGHQFVYQVRGKVVPGGFRPGMGWFGQCPIPLFNMSILESVRRQTIVDKDVTGLPELRKKIVFSRIGNDLVVDVRPRK
jgi:hypothetical protein